MPFNNFKRNQVWTPRTLTRLQRRALKWPFPYKGHFATFLLPFAITLGVTFLFLVVLIPMMSPSYNGMTLEQLLVAVVLALVILLCVALAITHGAVYRELDRMRSSHDFRFPKMQDATPSFKVLHVLWHIRHKPLSDADEDTISQWLASCWSTDYEYVRSSERQDHAEAQGELLRLLRERVLSLEALPIMLEDDERTKLGEELRALVEENRRGYEFWLRKDVVGLYAEQSRVAERIDRTNALIQQVKRDQGSLRVEG